MKKITQEELSRILQQHKLWIETNGVTGQCAELQGTDLSGLNAQYANLQGANLQGAQLNDANLRGTNLQGADLFHANLLHANLQGAQFDTNIRDCYTFYSAKFTPDALPWLILHPRWPEWKNKMMIETE